jgi:hypothetical protein
MSRTHGGKAIDFSWHFSVDQLTIKNERGIVHDYSLDEMAAILSAIKENFSSTWFPLANNVEKLSNRSEIKGLGTLILDYKPNDIKHAQGASYLGVVLEEIGFFEWNGKTKGIKWKLKDNKFGISFIKNKFHNYINPAPSIYRESFFANEKWTAGEYSIEKHKHNFAIWAAARAAQRGFASTAMVKQVLEDVDIQNEVERLNRDTLTAREFKDWHKRICDKILEKLKKRKKNASFGRVAKLVAIYIKVVVVIGMRPDCTLAKLAHPPIDRILLKQIASKYSTLGHMAKLKWTQLSSEKYDEVIFQLLDLVRDEPFWKLERFWSPAEVE